MSQENDWRDVRGYEGLYIVSSNGEILRTKKYNNSKDTPRKAPLTHGYPRVGLSKNGIVHYHLVHRLVADAFIGIKDKQIINHLDGNRENCRLENLEICDYSRNEWHKRHVLGKSTRPNFTKLSTDSVANIRQRLANGETGASIARHYNVSKSLISQIRRGHIWR